MISQRLPILFLLAGAAASQGLSSATSSGPRLDGASFPNPVGPAHDQAPARADGPLGDELARRAPPRTFATVLHDDPGTGELWAVGADWKASFGADGFTFVPFFGVKAPRNFPVRFRIASVQVGGLAVPFATDSKPARAGDRITFDRGAVREVYDLSLAHVEQTFVVDTTLAGDVEIRLAADSELTQDPQAPGLQFGNALGAVRYGEAFTVRGQDKIAIESSFCGSAIHLHVPASLRGQGPVVVDPLISTQHATFHGQRPASNPDVAYDVTNDVYLVVWESLFSATDTDVHCEMFDGAGNPIPGSSDLIDGTSVPTVSPRVASDNRVDQFLVVLQRADPIVQFGRSLIYCRSRDARTRNITPLALISDSIFGGHSTEPDVGGDSGTGAGGLGWPVVWNNNGSIHMRFVGPSGIPRGSDLEIDRDTFHPLSAPRIARGNGQGIVPNPGWLIVYSRQDTATEHDVVGIHLTAGGVFSNPMVIDVGNAGDDFHNPHVSSPATNSAGTRTWHLVTYERQSPAAAIGVVFDATIGAPVSFTDLSVAFGCGPFWVRAASDGIRFAVTSSVGTNADSVAVATLAFDGGRLVMHEAPQALPGLPSRPSIVSLRSGGGPHTNYAIACIDVTQFPVRAGLTLYGGHAQGVPVVRRPTACNGLSIQSAGLPFLGNAVRVTLANFGSAVPGFAIGIPPASPILLCSTCALGIRPDGLIFVTFGGASLDLPIPADVHLVGAAIAVQGIAIGGSTCLGNVSLSDTFELSIR